MGNLPFEILKWTLALAGVWLVSGTLMNFSSHPHWYIRGWDFPRVIAAGRFYALERSGRGRASLHRLSTGRLALRFDGFATSPNTDLFVWLSSAARPRDTVRAAGSPHTVLRALKATLGEQNYLIPADVKAGDIRSVVIWCVPVRIAYTAAALRATRPATARGRSPSSTASR